MDEFQDVISVINTGTPEIRYKSQFVGLHRSCKIHTGYEH